jgi:hypothetical protein
MLTLPNVTLDHKFFMRFPTSTANPGEFRIASEVLA